jgi:hypothetical protein
MDRHNTSTQNDDLTERTRFHHTPLNRDVQEIRVLQIQHSSNERDSIRLRLKHIVIGGPADAHIPPWIKRNTRSELWNHKIESHAFTALSYVWGPAEPRRVVWVSDPDKHGWMAIHPNLYDFFQTVRRDAKAAPFTWFWIDQVSINQRDDLEKGHQVRLMSELYTRATNVEVWLTPVTPKGGREAIEWVSEIGSLSLGERADFQFRRGLSEKEKEKAYFQKRRQHQKPIMDGFVTHYKALLDIIQLPYWSRLWVVQEMILGYGVKIRIGDTIAPWQPLRAGLRRFMCKMDVFKLPRGSAPYIQALADVGTIDRLQALPIWSFIEDTSASFNHWADVAILVNGKGCTDVRDKAFGMLGLLQTPLRLEPSYTVKPQEILLTILRKELAYTVMLNEKRWGNRSGLGTLAQIWYVLLQSPDYEDIDLGEIRHFLLHEAHPALRSVPLEPHFDQASLKRLLAVIWFLTHSIGVGPGWLARIRLRWMLPGKDSVRLRFRLRRSADNLKHRQFATNTAQKTVSLLYNSKHAFGFVPAR